MELIIIVALVGLAGIWFYNRKKHESAEVSAQPTVVAEAPYKVETPAPVEVKEPVTSVIEKVEPVEAVVTAPAPKGKKGRKPRITSDPRDVNHDGVTSEEEKRTWALADARDTNHDGVISAEEKSVAKRAAKAARKPNSKQV
jgi:hypothetical protein